MARVLWQGSLARLTRCSVGLFNHLVYYGGPCFVLLAVLLIGLCAASFLHTVLPWLAAPRQLATGGPTDALEPSPATDAVRPFVYYAHSAAAYYLLACIAFHYYGAVMTPPGGTEAFAHRVRERATAAAAGAATDAATEDHAAASPEKEAVIPLARDAKYDLEAALDGRGVPQKIGARYCRKCDRPKPDRGHHCSVCRRCVLKMDHHCPWISNCVGHANHRYFYLFLVYMAAGAAYFVVSSLPIALHILEWRVSSSPRLPPPGSPERGVFVLAWMLALFIGAAVAGMAVFHTWLIARGMTTIEYYGRDVAEAVASLRGNTYINEYDLGPRRNFRVFFNLGPDRPWWTVLVPRFVAPLSDGTVWLRADDLVSRHSTAWLRHTDFKDHLLPV